MREAIDESAAIARTARDFDAIMRAKGYVVSLDEKSLWTVTGTSYLTSLTIARGAAVAAPHGKALTMTVDGKETAPAPGTYIGEIVLTVA